MSTDVAGWTNKRRGCCSTQKPNITTGGQQELCSLYILTKLYKPKIQPETTPLDLVIQQTPMWRRKSVNWMKQKQNRINCLVRFCKKKRDRVIISGGVRGPGFDKNYKLFCRLATTLWMDSLPEPECGCDHGERKCQPREPSKQSHVIWMNSFHPPFCESILPKN